MSGVTVNLETIIDVMCQVYDDDHNLVIAGFKLIWIEDLEGVEVADFDTFDQLYKWTLDRQSELDEQRKEQLKQQARDYKDSEPTKHRW